MAITNAQQFKQLVNPPMKGKKRPGYRGDAAYGDRTDKGAIGDGPAKSGPTNNQVDTGDFGAEEANVKQNIAATLGGSGRSDPIESVNKLRRFLNRRPTVKKLPPIGPFGIATNLFNKQFQRLSDFTTKKNRDFFQKVVGAGRLNLGGKTIDLETIGKMTDEELEDAYQDYMSARMNNEIDAYGNPINRDRDGPPILIPPITAQAPSITEEEPEYVNPLSLLTPRIAGTQFAADGGRIGFQGGGKDLGAGASGMGSGGKDRTRDKDGDPRDRRRVEQYKKPPSQTKPDPSVFDKTKALATVPLNFIGSLFGNPFDPKKPIQVINTKAQKDYLNYLANQKEDDTGVLSYDDYGTKFNLSDLKDPIAFSTAMTMGGTGFKKADTGDITYTGGTYDFDGAVPFIDSGGLMGLAYRGGEFLGDKLKPAKLAEGGMASLEDMDREGFLLGGIAKGLKKAVRGIKKLAKSPIGKAALTYAAFTYGPQLLSGKGFGLGKATKFSQLKLFGGDIPINPVRFAGIPAVLAGAMTPKEDKDKFDIDAYYAANQLEPSQSIRGMGSDFDFYGGRIASAEGGSTDKEPVAKKTMPLLDMGGKEMDLREEGGFVPIGRMEKADDVPARLSKNEFVFTADAVRNAGDGDVDKGAEVMYNMMKNLEAGGDVSEESQGLEGARKMFQTSQRLEEVL